MAINRTVCQGIADDLKQKWCLPGKNGGGVSYSVEGDYCEFTVTVADKLVSSTIVKMILKAAVFEQRYLASSVRPSYIFVIKITSAQMEVSFTEDGILLFTRKSSMQGLRSVAEILTEISRLIAFSFLPNIWNNKESVNFCQPLCLAYRHIWWRAIRDGVEMTLPNSVSLASNTPAVFQLGSTGLKELLYSDFSIPRKNGVIVNEFAHNGLVSVTAGTYKFSFACIQLSPSHTTVFYMLRTNLRTGVREREEYRAFMSWEEFSKAIPNMVSAIGLSTLMPEMNKRDKSFTGIILKVVVSDDTEVYIDTKETVYDESDVATKEDMFNDAEFDNTGTDCASSILESVGDSAESELITSFEDYAKYQVANSTRDRIYFGCEDFVNGKFTVVASSI